MRKDRKRDLDRIRLSGIRGFGRHGVLPEERLRGQEFVVDVELFLPLKKAGKNDDIDYTIEYGAVAIAVSDIIRGEPVNLIETLAERIAAKVLDFPLVVRTVVTVHKPSAPIPVDFADVSVQISRTRD